MNFHGDECKDSKKSLAQANFDKRAGEARAQDLRATADKAGAAPVAFVPATPVADPDGWLHLATNYWILTTACYMLSFLLQLVFLFVLSDRK